MYHFLYSSVNYVLTFLHIGVVLHVLFRSYSDTPESIQVYSYALYS